MQNTKKNDTAAFKNAQMFGVNQYEILLYNSSRLQRIFFHY